MRQQERTRDSKNEQETVRKMREVETIKEI